MRFILLLCILVALSFSQPHWTVPDMGLTPIRNPNLGRKVNIPADVVPDKQLTNRMRNPNLGGFVDIPIVF
uniref:Uncharacterized protein n=1 Tax=Pristionchus pacificus TaxID=54126 RepID=A0A2A6CRF3_PRIPA|eukprot:PDM80700.1 hypothetical protein PRIPAC_35703 [Pristionchus pacificus]